MDIRTLPAEVVERFHAAYEATDGCWLWLGATRDGYGYFTRLGNTLQAHRVAYVLAGKSLPDDWTVRHWCGERRCVNPAHLYSLPSGTYGWRSSGAAA